MTAIRAAGLILGFAGALVIFAPWRSGGSVRGAAACLTASFLYGVLFVYAGRYLTGRGLDPMVLSRASSVRPVSCRLGGCRGRSLAR